MTESGLERELLALWRKAGVKDRERIARLLAGILSGRLTLGAGQARYLSRAEVAALADCLPADLPTNWLSQRPN